MRLLLIRHGQTSSNVAGSLDTRIPGPGLTALGVVQAASLPQALEEEKIEAIYASVMVRSQLTAAPVAEAFGLDVKVRGAIREVGSGDWGTRSDRGAVEAYESVVEAWADGDTELRMPGAENGVETFARYDSVIAEAEEAGYSTVAFVSHGAIIRAWSGYNAHNLNAHFIATHMLRNTGIVILDGSLRTGWTALAYMGEAVGGPDVDDPQHDGPESGPEAGPEAASAAPAAGLA
jgi:probable phosphoglycerate mutase